MSSANGQDGPAPLVGIASTANVKRPSTTSGFKASLCDICQGVGITADSFVITKKTHVEPWTQGSHKPSRHIVTARGSGPLALLKSGVGDISLPPWSIITKHAEQETCSLCWLVWQAVVKYSCSKLDKDQQSGVNDPECAVRWELDGHDEISESSFANRTRRLRLMWKMNQKPQIREAFLVVVAHGGVAAANTDAVSLGRREVAHQHKSSERDTGKQALIKSWIDLCREHHQGTCDVKVTQGAAFKAVLKETYFGVIDVTNLQLTPLPFDESGKPAKYVALSYVWGKPKKPYTTTRANVPLRRRHGGLETELSQFPAAIRDAISLVQKLNLRYLWVDAICIVQDSTSSFRLNAQIMHTIYGNAYFTICAADGTDATTGLLALDEKCERPQIEAEVVPGVKLQITRQPEEVIQDSTWNTRGWTYQERILSRRCVIFAENGTYFQCRKAALSEDVYNDLKGSGWSLQAMNAPLRYFPEIELRAFSFYMKSVAMFYRRNLTNLTDILAAYKGLESILVKNMNAPFCYGLPTSHFDLALLWQPKRAIRRRECPKHEFPSWSWCGWVGGDLSYDAVMLEGCLLNVQEWLRDHTFVRWHICGGTGRLRPLWHAERVYEDMSLEARWRGYKGIQNLEDEASYTRADDNSNSDAESSLPYSSPSPPPRRARNIREDVYDFKRGRFVPQEEREVVVYEEHDDLPSRSRTKSGNVSKDKPTQDGYKWLNRRAATKPRPLIRSRIAIDKSYAEDDADSDNEQAEEQACEQRIAQRLANNNKNRITSDNVNPLRVKFDLRCADPERDSWGRPLSRYSPRALRSLEDFKLAHSETPYGVRRTRWEWLEDVPGYQSLPDLPILQFYTSRQRLRVIEVSADADTGLSRCTVADQAGDWCGSVVVNSDWIVKHNGSFVHFIALSDAKAFSAEESPSWTYYTPYERSESEWEACYALLVESNPEKHVYERVGLAKIFKDAFNGACWEEIMLG